MRRYGFIASGYGRFYSSRLNQLSPGDPVFVYQKGAGYIGYGIVRNEAVMAKEFVTGDDRPLSEIELRSPGILHDPEDPEMADYVVGVDWKKTFPISEGKWFEGGFANQNVVCKLRHQEAAERVCGGPLIEGGKPGQLRAQVWPASKPSARKMFYTPA